MPIDLDISALEKAGASLEAGLTRRDRAPDGDMIRDARIQRFDFPYALSHKTLERFLEATSANAAALDGMSAVVRAWRLH